MRLFLTAPNFTLLEGPSRRPLQSPGRVAAHPPPGRHDVVVDGVVREPLGHAWRPCPLSEAKVPFGALPLLALLACQ